MSEEHNTRLTQTVDKLLFESNERLQVHLNERMNSLEEKNNLAHECDKLKKQLEDLEGDKLKISNEIEKYKLDLENIRKENLNLQQKFKDLSSQYSSLLKANTNLNNTLNNLNETTKLFNNNNNNFSNNTSNTTDHNLTNGGSGLFFPDQLNGPDLDFSLNNPIFMNSQSLYMPNVHSQQQQQQHQQQSTHYNNHSPSFSINSLKLRNRNQYSLSTTPTITNKLINDQTRMQHFLNESNDLITSTCSLAPVSTTTTNTITNNNNNNNTMSQMVPAAPIADLNDQTKQTIDESDWDKLEEAAKVIANVQHAFEMSDNEINDYNDEGQTYHHLNHRMPSNTNSRHLINRNNYTNGHYSQNGHLKSVINLFSILFRVSFYSKRNNFWLLLVN